MVGAVLVGISGALTLSLINNANDGMFNMNLHSKAGLAKAARMEEIREEAFKLHCTSGCSDGSIDTNLDYDKSEIEDHCSNQTLGLALLERLQNKNPDLASDFDLQNYDPTSPSLPIFSNITANGNSLIVTLSSDAAKTPMTSTIVPNALGWCK
ncbi:hypothetical protein [Synechococcus sp. KORDI-52]|uniref:hypothetical protein n=1 Tax=Synechococcus sp. KORDI-52 TaxID=585425 RepID=UPI001C1E70DF|nr:hypothetical protein [Synechococcus sp. KORDI-52]